MTPAAIPSITLYDWPVSPFCMKVRLVLEHKGLPYTRLPALAHRREVARRGGVGKVPALAIGDELWVDSTDIVYGLERRFPTMPVLPADPAARALCHVLEDWTDESLYFFGLYYHWYEPAGHRAARAYFARTWIGRLAFTPYSMRVRRQLWGHGISRKTPAHVADDLERILDAVDVLLSRPARRRSVALRLRPALAAALSRTCAWQRAPGRGADERERVPRANEGAPRGAQDGRVARRVCDCRAAPAFRSCALCASSGRRRRRP